MIVMKSSTFFMLLRDFVPAYHYAVFGMIGRQLKEKCRGGGHFVPPSVYILSKKPSLNRVKVGSHDPTSGANYDSDSKK